MSEQKKADISAMNIFEKMLHIQSEIPTVAKNLKVETGKNSRPYKAVSERDVKDAIKPLEEKYGVYSYPYKKELIEQTILEQQTQNGVRKSFYIRERVTYRFININKPDEFIEIDGYGDGIDTGDKATGKADTYASKYCLMSAYKISTGDDPDAQPSPDEGYKKQSAPQQKEPQKPHIIDPAEMAVELTRLRTELTKGGVDIRSEAFVEYVKKTAQVNTIEPGMLLGDPPAMNRVIQVMRAIIQTKS